MNTTDTTPQPIATAKREPTEMLLLFAGDWYIGWWHMERGWLADWCEIHPTHWLPLPDKPDTP